MGTLNKYLTGVIAVSVLYLLVMNADNANKLLTGLANANASMVRSLQGR